MTTGDQEGGLAAEFEALFRRMPHVRCDMCPAVDSAWWPSAGHLADHLRRTHGLPTVPAHEVGDGSEHPLTAGGHHASDSDSKTTHV